MHRLRSFVPSANYLFVFEAAARRLNFTAAAAELNVSQPAVSKTIRLLEEATGLKLFRRQHGRLELTLEGERLFKETQKAFDNLYMAVTSMQAHHTHDIVRVSFSTVFVQFWLLPRLQFFKQLYPDIVLHIEANNQDNLDLQAENIDISSRLGTGQWSDVQAWAFAEEEVWPVCSPTYLQQYGSMRTLDDLATHRLIHFEERYRPRINWQEWFKKCGAGNITVRQDFVCADTASAMRAVILGQGIALGWKHLIHDHITDGQLVVPLRQCWRSGHKIYLITPAQRPPKPGAVIFRDWLLAQNADADLLFPS